MTGQTHGGSLSDPTIQSAIATFKTHPTHRLDEARRLLPLIKPRTPSVQVKSMLGKPTETVWEYGLFYSSFLAIRFDAESRLVEVSSDLSPAGDASDDPEHPDTIAAIREFKAQPYQRQRPAEILLAVLKEQMPAQQVEVLLGTPSRTAWEYSLSESPCAFLLVRLDSESNVEDAGIYDDPTSPDSEPRGER